jgi:hypothetical protein
MDTEKKMMRLNTTNPILTDYPYDNPTNRKIVKIKNIKNDSYFETMREASNEISFDIAIKSDVNSMNSTHRIPGMKFHERSMNLSAK